MDRRLWALAAVAALGLAGPVLGQPTVKPGVSADLSGVHSDATGPWDLYTLPDTIQGADAFREQ